MKERDKRRKESNKENGWGVLLPCLSPTPWRLGEGETEMVSTVTAGSWWPGMWAINSAVGRFTPPSPLPLCLLLGWGGRIPYPNSQSSRIAVLIPYYGIIKGNVERPGRPL